MSQLIAMIMQADDWVNLEVMPEVWRQPMPRSNWMVWNAAAIWMGWRPP
jgi:hypothetical protein